MRFAGQASRPDRPRRRFGCVGICPVVRVVPNLERPDNAAVPQLTSRDPTFVIRSGDLFRYDARRLDGRLQKWLLEARNIRVDLGKETPFGPGFTGGDLQFLADATWANMPKDKAIHRHLDSLAYWLFCGKADPAIVHPTTRSVEHSVLYASATGELQGPHGPNQGRYLSVWALGPSGPGPAALTPFPDVHDVLIGLAQESFWVARQALHAAAIDCVDRVNLVWPVAVALAT